MLKSRIKNITFLIGVLTMFVGGLIFIVMSDLTFKNNSGNLIITVLLCFGSAIIFFFANNFIEKPVIMYVMKGIGLALAIGLIVYYHWFSTSEYYIAAVEKLRKAGLAKKKEYASAKASIVIALVFSYIGMAVQAANTVLMVVLKDDDERPEKNNAELPQEQPMSEAASEAGEAETIQE